VKIGYTGVLSNGSKRLAVSEDTAKRLGWDGLYTGQQPKIDDRQRQLCYMYIRDPAKNNTLFERVVQGVGEKASRVPMWLIFKMNPTTMNYTRGLKTSVQHGMNSYVVHEGGFRELNIVLEGNFGYVRSDAPLVTDQFKTATGLKPEQINLQGGRDGWQAWLALYKLLYIYIEENQRRVLSNEPLLELIWADPLHSLNDADANDALMWVVTPKEMASLSHKIETQGILPYKLELIGVRDIRTKVRTIATPNLTPKGGSKVVVRPIPAPTAATGAGGGTSGGTGEGVGTGTPNPTSPILSDPATRFSENYHFLQEDICIYYAVFTLWGLYRAHAKRKLGGNPSEAQLRLALQRYDRKSMLVQAGRLNYLIVNRWNELAARLYSYWNVGRFTDPQVRGVPIRQPLSPEPSFWAGYGLWLEGQTDELVEPFLPKAITRQATINTYDAATAGITIISGIDAMAGALAQGDRLPTEDRTIPYYRIGGVPKGDTAPNGTVQ
jgi:hypothetical protein